MRPLEGEAFLSVDEILNSCIRTLQMALRDNLMPVVKLSLDQVDFASKMVSETLLKLFSTMLQPPLVASLNRIG